MKKLLCVSHYLGDVLGSFGEVARDRGYQIDLAEAHKNSVKGIDPSEHDVVILMGGPMGVYQADIFPWLNDEIAFVKKRLELGLPTLGVCLGAQIMAAALGSKVYKGAAGQELGWKPVKINEAGQQTPLRHFDRSLTSMMHWHGDTFDLPPGATLLASTELYPQSFSHGKNALAVQFHPEVTQLVCDEWIILGDFYTIEKHICPLPEFQAQTAKNVEILRAQTHKFFNEWLDSVLEN